MSANGETHGQDSRQLADYKELSGAEGRAKIAEMVKGIPIAMMTTVASDGSMNARPMAVQEKADFAESGGTLWFLTRITSDKVEEIGQDQHVTLTFAEPKDSKYVTLKGRASVLLDRAETKAKVKELWNPMYRAWFPGGAEDPEIGVLRVEVSEGEFWQASSSRLLMIAKYAASAVTGGRVSVGEAGHIAVR